MRFAFTEEQELLRRSVRDLLARACPPAAVRAGGFARERWRELARAGVLGLLVPEAHGGLGLSDVELALALEEAGRAALPEPLIETAAVAVPLLSEGPLCERWLSAIAAGDAVIAAAARGAPVADADVADLLLLEDERGFHALPRAAVALAPLRSVDPARRLFRVDWRPEDGVRLAGDAQDHGALGAAAFLLGLARRMLDMTVEYVKVRHQFGRPIGSFQAVKHHLANALGRVEIAAPTVARAAYAMAHREPARAVRVSMAKAFASDAATFVARIALQCHGAIGYAFDNDLQLYMKRTWALAAAWGDASWHRARVADAVLDGALELELGGS